LTNPTSDLTISLVLYHLSLNAKDTDRVAAVLAELLGGTVVRSPSPPFDPQSRFVCCWDDRGTMVEVGPWDVAFAPADDVQSDIVPSPTPERNYFHGLFLARVPVERILEIAAREGWPCALCDNGPFQVVNLWLEGRQLIELTTPELLPDYLATFGPANRDHLDGQLRELEAVVTAG
jgi:hypothetical protein